MYTGAPVIVYHIEAWRYDGRQVIFSVRQTLQNWNKSLGGEAFENVRNMALMHQGYVYSSHCFMTTPFNHTMLLHLRPAF